MKMNTEEEEMMLLMRRQDDPHEQQEQTEAGLDDDDDDDGANGYNTMSPKRRQLQQQARGREEAGRRAVSAYVNDDGLQEEIRRAQWQQWMNSGHVWLMMASLCFLWMMAVSFLVLESLQYHKTLQQQQQQQRPHVAYVSWGEPEQEIQLQQKNNQNMQTGFLHSEDTTLQDHFMLRYQVADVQGGGSQLQFGDHQRQEIAYNDDEDDNVMVVDDDDTTTATSTVPSFDSDDDTLEIDDNNHRLENDNDDQDEDSNDDDDEQQQQEEEANPAVYGWTPDRFPNPMENTAQCAIAYLLEDPQKYIPQPMMQQQQAEETRVYNNQTSQQPENEPEESTSFGPLRLCDPDWVLGGIYLEQVAAALWNFSAYFGGQDVILPSSQGRRRRWDVQFGGQRRRRHLLVQPQPPIEKQLDFVPNVALSALTHMVRGANSTTTATTTTPAPEASSDQQQQQQQQQQVQEFSERYIPSSSSLPWLEYTERVELAVATARKMNLPAVLRQGSYYAYEDEDDMVNDAAQIFARTLHDAWWKSTTGANDKSQQQQQQSTSARNDDYDNYVSAATGRTVRDEGVLIFLSIQDRVCFISTGAGIAALLPWWRLDHIVAQMKPDLRRARYGPAVLQAVAELSSMLESGPPTWMDRIHDFLTRFGVVIAFAIFTFLFGAWGEYRDRRKRWQHAEQRSQLTPVEQSKARQLQQTYGTRSCPICLEPFVCIPVVDKDEEQQQQEHNSDKEKERKDTTDDGEGAEGERKSLLHAASASSTDRYEFPSKGADGKKIKLLRCGHIFCETCWRKFIHSGCGNPCTCPVCRQDVGRCPRKHRTCRTAQQQQQQHEPANTADSGNGRSRAGGLSPITEQQQGGVHDDHGGQMEHRPLLSSFTETASASNYDSLRSSHVLNQNSSSNSPQCSSSTSARQAGGGGHRRDGGQQLFRSGLLGGPGFLLRHGFVATPPTAAASRATWLGATASVGRPVWLPSNQRQQHQRSRQASAGDRDSGNNSTRSESENASLVPNTSGGSERMLPDSSGSSDLPARRQRFTSQYNAISNNDAEDRRQVADLV